MKQGIMQLDTLVNQSTELNPGVLGLGIEVCLIKNNTAQRSHCLSRKSVSTAKNKQKRINYIQMSKENNHNEDTPDGYRRLYLYDEFDRFMSSTYDLEVDEYIRIIDTIMSDEDAKLFFDCTVDGEREKGRGSLGKYL